MTSETSRTAEATDLLQHMIRNRCVNDGSVGSGQEQRSADLLRSYLEGSGVDMETFEPEPGRTSLVAKIQGSDPTAPSLTLLGHTDVVPANADDWTPRPLRRRADRRSGVGAGGHRHAQPHRHHGHRHAPPGPGRIPSRRGPHLRGRRRRGGARNPRGQVAVRPRRRRGQLRLRDHRVGRVPHGRGRRDHPAAGDRRGEGRLLVHPDREGHPGPRQPTPADRQRPGQGGRGGPTGRRVPAPGPAARGMDPVHRGDRLPAGPGRAPARSRSHRWVLRRAPPGRPGPSGPRLHPHHGGTDHPAYRDQDQRDPRPGRARARHPIAPRMGHRRRAGHAGGGGRRSGRRRGHPVRVRGAVDQFSRSIPRCGTRWSGSVGCSIRERAPCPS